MYNFLRDCWQHQFLSFIFVYSFSIGDIGMLGRVALLSLGMVQSMGLPSVMGGAVERRNTGCLAFQVAANIHFYLCIAQSIFF
jgi:hypothetical protein